MFLRLFFSCGFFALTLNMMAMNSLQIELKTNHPNNTNYCKKLLAATFIYYHNKGDFRSLEQAMTNGPVELSRGCDPKRETNQAKVTFKAGNKQLDIPVTVVERVTGCKDLFQKTQENFTQYTVLKTELTEKLNAAINIFEEKKSQEIDLKPIENFLNKNVVVQWTPRFPTYEKRAFW